MITKKCLQCNKDFKKKPTCSKKEWANSKFCSHKCGYLNRNIGKKKSHCLNCKKEYDVKYKKGLYCSRTCKNRMWRGGIKTSVAKMVRSNFKYIQWRSDILTRDNWTCQTCGIKSGCGHTVYLETHHIKSFAEILKEEKIEFVDMINEKSQLWDINNGVTLCKSCHKLTDSYMKRLKNKVKFA